MTEMQYWCYVPLWAPMGAPGGIGLKDSNNHFRVYFQFSAERNFGTQGYSYVKNRVTYAIFFTRINTSDCLSFAVYRNLTL